MRGAVGAINRLGRKLTMNSERAIATTVALLALPGAAIANGELRFELQTPQPPVAHVLYDLHGIILGICILIAVVATWINRGVFGPYILLAGAARPCSQIRDLAGYYANQQGLTSSKPSLSARKPSSS